MGCQSTNQAAYKTLGSIAIVTDGAVQAYYQYRDNGHYDPVLDAKIKATYLHYQSVMKVAKDSEEAFNSGTIDKPVWQKTVEAVLASESDILNLIKQFNPKLLSAKRHQ